MVQPIVRNVAALFVCFALACSVFAQGSGILIKDPPVIRLVDRDSNETTISGLLFDPRSDLASLGFDPHRPPPEMRLHSVEYSYPGTVASRPQTFGFVFGPRTKYESAPTLSVTVDGQLLHEVQAILREKCCVEINGSKQTPQSIVATLPIETLARLTAAKKIELKLITTRGKFTFKLNDHQKKVLAALGSTIS